MLRHDFIATREESILVIVDFHQGLLKEMSEWEVWSERMQRLAKAAAILNVPVLVTEQYRRGLGETQADVMQAIDSPVVLEKTHFSACMEDNFFPALHAMGGKKIVVVGMEAHVCVLQTCLDLMQSGFQVHLVADAVTSRTPENKQIGIELMRQAGAIVSSTETVIFQWTKQACTDEFKQILPLVK